MELTPAIAIHLAAAIGATALGPLALWARRGTGQHPRLHRAAGYAWVTLMVATAISALFITASVGPRWGDFGVIHLLVPATLFGLVGSFIFLARRNVAAHRKIMLGLYFGACLSAGAFTLLPDRYLGQALWGTLSLV